MLLLVRNLLKENKDLRSMVKSMTAFIGEGELLTLTELAELLPATPRLLC
jgi:hypothetical protein